MRKMNNTKLKLRFMKDLKNRRYWAEELIGSRWVKIEGTDMACEGNVRTTVKEYIEKKRAEYYRLFVEQIGEDQEFDMGF